MIERYYKYTRMYHLKVSICTYMMKIPNGLGSTGKIGTLALVRFI